MYSTNRNSSLESVHSVSERAKGATKNKKGASVTGYSSLSERLSPNNDERGTTMRLEELLGNLESVSETFG